MLPITSFLSYDEYKLSSLNSWLKLETTSLIDVKLRVVVALVKTNGGK